MKTIEYYITKVGGQENFFKIAKFEGEEQPTNVYFLVMKRKGERGYADSPDPSLATDPQFHCDCPNRRRGKHINDKHGQMVAKWLLAGAPAGHFDQNGEFHGSQGTNERDLYDGAYLDGSSDDDSDEEGEGY